jgi:hypothetical protein
MDAFDAVKNKKTAAKIAGTDEKNLSTAQRLGAGAASYASALTGGLVSAQSMYKVGNTAWKAFSVMPGLGRSISGMMERSQKRCKNYR